MMKVLSTCAAKCEAGATAIEYALTAALVSVALISGGDTLRAALDDQFMSLSKALVTASEEHRQSGGGSSLISSGASAKDAVLATGASSLPPKP